LQAGDDKRRKAFIRVTGPAEFKIRTRNSLMTIVVHEGETVSIGGDLDNHISRSSDGAPSGSGDRQGATITIQSSKQSDDVQPSDGDNAW